MRNNKIFIEKKNFKNMQIYRIVVKTRSKRDYLGKLLCLNKKNKEFSLNIWKLIYHMHSNNRLAYSKNFLKLLNNFLFFY